MFYSHALLSPNGPLATVWLSSTMERKLTKASVLQADLPAKIQMIMMPGEAPLALRLASQLLLGVVRIYSRKTRYLLEDCNEALLKIKLAFRASGNNDIAVNVNVQNRDSLILPDRITMYDNLELPPLPDMSWPSTQLGGTLATPISRKSRANNRDINLPEDFRSRLLQEDDLDVTSLELAPPVDIDLDLDFSMDLFNPPSQLELSREVGRDAPTEAGLEDDIFGTLPHPPLLKDRAVQERSINTEVGDYGVRIIDQAGDMIMADDTDFQFALGDQSVQPATPIAPGLDRARISESPLSDIDSIIFRMGEAGSVRTQSHDLYEQQDHVDEATVVRKPAQRARKQKLLRTDDETVLNVALMKAQQADRRHLLKPPAFLPRDPYLMDVMDMQKKGAFIRILSGHSEHLAPELCGMLSLDWVRGHDESRTRKKRKQDSSDLADESSDRGGFKSPRLEHDDRPTTSVGRHSSVPADVTIREIPAQSPGDNFDHHDGIMGDDRAGPGLPFSDAVPMPPLSPAPEEHAPDGGGPGPASGKYTVSVLRDRLGPQAATGHGKRNGSSVLLQDLAPEKATSKADATKMFFDCLVLATKNAIKIEQGDDLGAPIRISSKEGLWSQSAELEALREMERETRRGAGDEEDVEVADDTEAGGAGGAAGPDWQSTPRLSTPVQAN